MADKKREQHEQGGHQKIVVRAGALAILVNVVLTGLKIAAVAASGSLAVMSDALHGLVDTLSGIIVIASEKIKVSRLQKLRNLSHAEIERIGARVIAVIILLVALHILVEAVEGLNEPGELEISVGAVAILVASVVAKIGLSVYLRRTSVRTGSETLRASSVEALNDAIISGAVLVSLIIQAILKVNIEPYISIFVVVLIVKSGVDLLR